MTKLIQQLDFSSSNYRYDVAIEPNPAPAKEKKHYFGDGASTLSTAGSKRSALSASDAECFSLCLGAGPLWLTSASPHTNPVIIGVGGPDVPVVNSAPPGGVSGGASSPATPSTPTHDDNSRDLLSALLWASAASLCSSADSLAEQGPPAAAADIEQREQVIAKILERKDKQPVRVEFNIYLTENTNTRWEAVVSGGTLYLRVPTVLAAGSKESFMLLLDFAEERLGLNSCIICVLKSRPDRATLLRTFMFMGFQLLNPASPLLPKEINNPDYIFLHYQMQ